MVTVRNRYIDVLRALALMRVLTFHLYGWDWLPLLFPSMGVLFAFAGSLIASSLDRYGSVGRVLFKRLRRLLPPLWAMGLVLVPIMLLVGWSAEDDLSQPFWPWVLSWIFPITEPPGSDFGVDWTLPLWYLRTYLWLVLLSPGLLWLWRRAPKTMFVLPLLGVLLVTGGLLPFDLLPLEGPFRDGIVAVLTYATCWMIGFAHHDGTLQKIGFHWIFLLGLLFCAAGVAWAIRYRIWDEILPPNVSDIPMATALYSAGFALVLVRLPITMAFIGRVPVLRDVIDVINRRAMTFYLWGSVAIFVAQDLLERYGVYEILTDSSWLPATELGATLAVLFLIILALGWVEDLAAGRRPRLLPVGPSPEGRPTSRHPATTQS